MVEDLLVLSELNFHLFNQLSAAGKILTRTRLEKGQTVPLRSESVSFLLCFTVDMNVFEAAPVRCADRKLCAQLPV